MKDIAARVREEAERRFPGAEIAGVWVDGLNSAKLGIERREASHKLLLALVSAASPARLCGQDVRLVVFTHRLFDLVRTVSELEHLRNGYWFEPALIAGDVDLADSEQLEQWKRGLPSRWATEVVEHVRAFGGACCKAPIGFHWRGRGTAKHLVPDRREIAIMRRCYDLRREGYSRRGVAAKLLRERVRWPRTGAELSEDLARRSWLAFAGLLQLGIVEPSVA